MAEERAASETIKPRQSGVGLAAQQMIEALSLACSELDKTVQLVVEQLDTFNKSLEKNFANRLGQLAQRATTAIETSVDDLARKNEDLIDHMADLERVEIETVVLAAEEMRQQLSSSAQQATAGITLLIAEEIKQLQALVNNPQPELAELSRISATEIDTLAKKSQETIERETNDYKRVLLSNFEGFENQAESALAATKQKLSDKILGYEQEFERKIAQIKNDMTRLAETTMGELANTGRENDLKLTNYSREASKKLSGHINDWQENLSYISSEYQTSLGQNKHSFEELHTIKLATKVTEAKDEINKIARETQTKFSTSHKLFAASLKRLEKQYYDRLEHLFLQFERALAQEAHLTPFGGAYPLQAGSELKGILRARLQARGVEIVKGFKRQVELFESEYTRVSAGSHERLETVRVSAIDNLEKQAKNMSLEAAKLLRSLKNELAIYNLQLPEIDDAGHTAALAVKAYRSARLSFGSD